LPFDLKNLLQLYPTTAGMAFFAEIERGIHVLPAYMQGQTCVKIT